MLSIYCIVISGHRQKTGGSKIEVKLKRREDFQGNLKLIRESYFYKKLMPQFTQFQNEKSLQKADQIKFLPKYYEAISNVESGAHAIIIEDLRPKKFAMWPKEKI